MEHLYSDVAIVGNETLYDIDSVKQSIITLLKTHKGERLFRPSVGSNLEDYLWLNVDESTALDIKSEIMRVVEQDYRAMISEISVTPDSVNSCYNVVLKISVKGLESSVDLVLKKKGL